MLSLEIFAGQLLTPAFGDSVFKWLWVLIASMVGLTIGYGTAYYCSQCARRERLVIVFLLTGLCYEAAVPLWFDPILSRLIEFPGHLPLAVASACVVLVPMVLFGMVPGLLVALTSTDDVQGTPHAGRVFAASTVGGLLGGLVVGTVLIPTLGVTVAIRCTTGALLLLVVILRCRSSAKTAGALALCVWTSLWFLPRGGQQTTPGSKLLDYKEGILGQVAVVERTLNQTTLQRILYVNRMSQSVHRVGEPISSRGTFSYVKEALPILASYPKEADVLLLGLGGGTLVHVMRQLELKVTVVELDRRIIEVAQRHFDAPQDAEYILDDARRFIRRSGRTFDVIFFDAYRGEYPPTHLITLESLRELERALRPRGVVLINVAGRIDSPDSETVRSMVKTIRAAGFRCRAVRGQPSFNTLLVVDRGDREYTEPINSDRAQQFGIDMQPAFFDDSTLSYDKARTLTDDKPVLEALYRADARRFREGINVRYTDRRERDPVPLYR